MSTRKLVESIDWPTLSSALAKRSQVVQSLSSFNKKYQELDRELSALREQKTDLDFAHYRGILKNTKVVNEMQAKFSAYKIEKLDTKEYTAAISQFEQSAVASAAEYSQELEGKLAGLVATVQNIENTRPVTQLTVNDVVEARPETVTEIQALVSKGDFTVKGYDAKFPDVTVG